MSTICNNNDYTFENFFQWNFTLLLFIFFIFALYVINSPNSSFIIKMLATGGAQQAPLKNYSFTNSLAPSLRDHHFSKNDFVKIFLINVLQVNIIIILEISWSNIDQSSRICKFSKMLELIEKVLKNVRK